MADITVFVDDAVRGTLPAVCARNGVPTSDSLQRRQEVGNRGGLGVAWLLILAGPLGWLGLIAISVMRSGRVEELQVRLPMSEPAYQRMRTSRQLRDRSMLALLVATVATLVLLSMRDSTTLTSFGLVAAIAVAVVSFATMIVGSWRCDRETVGVSLDASRRWVTLSNVHPQFAAACQAHEASQLHRA
jgi:hypothetical protein